MNACACTRLIGTKESCGCEVSSDSLAGTLVLVVFLLKQHVVDLSMRLMKQEHT